MRDYYEILGVARDADGEIVKKAYRKLALQYHPDRNNGDKGSEEKFKEATEAYEVLRDADKRAAYDRYGHAGVKGRQAQAGFGFDDALNIFMRDFGGFGFEDLFGGRQQRGGAQRGKDVRMRLPLTLQEVATGVTRKLKVKVLQPCEGCSGSGSADAGAAESCEACGGAGEVRQVQRTVFGQFVTASVCPACQGEGRRIANPCTRCHGDGRTRGEREIEVRVPAGVETGNFLTMRGQGNVGVRGGPPGDVQVVMEVEEDPRFARDGEDLVTEIPISFSQAALGAEIEVPLVAGEETVAIRAGTQSGDVLTLRGRGLPRLQGHGRGDLHVRLHVWTPERLGPEQEELLRRLGELEGTGPTQRRQPRQTLWEKVREAFTG
jgi:molecular chaperone DnaJ